VVSGAMSWLAGHPGRDLVAVAIAPDLGERYLDTIYNPTWVADLCGDAVLTSPARTAGPRAA
jgi:N-(2-amino-2-carboxyethyl)-L-glutamate synthase